MRTQTRFRSGDACTHGDAYRFDGYVSAPADELPHLGELEVSLDRGQTFPLIESTKLECWWVRADEPATWDLTEAARREAELRFAL